MPVCCCEGGSVGRVVSEGRGCWQTGGGGGAREGVVIAGALCVGAGGGGVCWSVAWVAGM